MFDKTAKSYLLEIMIIMTLGEQCEGRVIINMQPKYSKEGQKLNCDLPIMCEDGWMKREKRHT